MRSCRMEVALTTNSTALWAYKAQSCTQPLPDGHGGSEQCQPKTGDKHGIVTQVRTVFPIFSYQSVFCQHCCLCRSYLGIPIHMCTFHYTLRSWPFRKKRWIKMMCIRKKNGVISLAKISPASAKDIKSTWSSASYNLPLKDAVCIEHQ